MTVQKQIPECDQALTGLLSKVPGYAKFAFVSTFATGLLIHLYMFTGKYPNHDEIYSLYSANSGSGFGRWMLRLYSAFSSNASLPLVIGIISLVALSVCCVLIVSMLHIEKRHQVFLTGLIIVSLPPIANGFTWMHCSDGFLISMMLGVLGAYVTDRYRLGFLPGLVLLVLALAGYQASLCVAIALLAVRYLQLLLIKRSTDREMLLRLLRYAVCVFGAAAVYVLVTRLLTPRLAGEALFSHSGIDTMGVLRLSDIPSRIWNAYVLFAQYLLRTTMLTSWRFVRYLQMAIGALEIALILWTLFRTPKKSWFQTVFALVITAALPVLFTSICIMTDSGIHILMLNSIGMFYVTLIVANNALRDSCAEKPAKALRVSLQPLAGYAVAALLLFVGLVYAVSDNALYLGLQLKYENTYALSNRVVGDIEKTEGYVVGETPVYIGGSFTATYPNSKQAVFQPLSHHDGFQSVSEYNLIISDRHFHYFVRDYIGIPLGTADAEAIEAGLASEAYADMPVYPYAGSVRLIDGIVFVKASEY